MHEHAHALDSTMAEVAKEIHDKFGACDLRIARVSGVWFAEVQSRGTVTWSSRGTSLSDAITNLLANMGPS